MYVHLHLSRKLMGWVFTVLAIVPTALCFAPSISSRMELAPVTGHMTYSGKPLKGMTLCLDSPGGVHCAYATLRADGSFRLVNMNLGDIGAMPGRYHAHLYSEPHGPSLPAKYADSRTSGLEIDIASDWNDLVIDLH